MNAEQDRLRLRHMLDATEKIIAFTKGVSASEFLICAVAATEHLQILTTDADFLRYTKHLPIHLTGVKP
jgi:predicted nucleic acid-binding protein